MQTELEYTAQFPESLYEPLIWDSEEALVQIFSLDESHWDYCNLFPALPRLTDTIQSNGIFTSRV